MTIGHIFAVAGLIFGGALMAMGFTGIGIGRRWGSGRWDRTTSILFGLVFVLLELHRVITLPEWSETLMAAAGLVLVVVVAIRWSRQPR